MSIAMSEFDSQVTVRRRRFASEENGWAVLDAAGDDGTGGARRAADPPRGARARARIGTWVDDSRYGKQVKVSEARPLPPTDRSR